jgi:sodium-dependent dicarboxylate transporter 2/3/5
MAKGFPDSLRRAFAFGVGILGAVAALLAPGTFELRASLVIFALVAILWMTQALPLAVTALLVPLLAAGSGVMEPGAAFASFGHPVIFLFLGGFALAAALQVHGLDQLLANHVVRLARGRRPLAVIALCAMAACLSMWISNTATAAMMLPLALGLLRPSGPEQAEPGAREKIFVLLALAYSCSIGGIATLVGSPPNAIAAAHAQISFVEWLRFGLPATAILWPAMLAILWLLLKPDLRGTVPLVQERASWSPRRLFTLVIFLGTVIAWLAGAALGRALQITADIDALVAVGAVVALVAARCLTWRDLEQRVQWGILLLFGGGLALSQLMQSSGASDFLAHRFLDLVRELHPVILMGAAILFVIFLTELVSNTASAALILPIFLPVAMSLGVSAHAAAAAIAIAASCAFMLPVATPPNALVFATNEVPQAWMMRCGLALNLWCVVVLTAMAWLH